MKRCGVLIGVAAAAFAGCGEDSEQPAAEGSPAQAQVQKAKPSATFAGNPDAYALDVAENETGKRERSGCLSATEVESGDYTESPAAESNPGCIYSAAFAGCVEGQTDEHSGVPGRHFTQEFPEPGLQDIYREARRACR